MRKALVKVTHTVLSLVAGLSLFATATAQTNSCDQIAGGVVGHQLSGSDPVTEFCSIAPADVVWGNNGQQLTCRNCFPGGGGQAPQFSKGGTANCTAYDQQMIIDFGQPVADLNWEIYGARTVTDNRGYTVHMNPAQYPDGHPMNSVVARFRGGGITRLVISDPIVYDRLYPNGTVEAPGFWQMDSIGVWWTPGSTYDQCNCNRVTFPRPLPQTAFSPDWNGNGIPDWQMDVEVSDNDGLVLKNIRLENRYMAEKISVPYYWLETNSITPAQRGQLTPDSTAQQMASRLVDYQVWHDDTKFVVQATYVIGQIPAGSTNCLEIVQRYEFYKRIPGDQCEPSGTLPCARWRPIVTYKFAGPPGELRSINIAQRQHRSVDQISYNSVGLFRDPDSGIEALLSGLDFPAKCNPVPHEWSGQIIANGKDAQSWDNIHQTYKSKVDEPSVSLYSFEQHKWLFVNPGCPECIHSHWRWGIFTGGEGSGNLIGLPSGSTQNVDGETYHGTPDASNVFMS